MTKDEVTSKRVSRAVSNTLKTSASHNTVDLNTKAPSAARRASRPAQIDPSQCYSVDEACAAMDVSRPFFYQMLAANQIKVIKRGARTAVPGSEIIRLNTPKAA